jgi:hypothetical protein
MTSAAVRLVVASTDVENEADLETGEDLLLQQAKAMQLCSSLQPPAVETNQRGENVNHNFGQGGFSASPIGSVDGENNVRRYSELENTDHHGGGEGFKSGNDRTFNLQEYPLKLETGSGTAPTGEIKKLCSTSGSDMTRDVIGARAAGSVAGEAHMQIVKLEKQVSKEAAMEGSQELGLGAGAPIGAAIASEINDGSKGSANDPIYVE